MKNGHKEIYKVPKMVTCPQCKGEGEYGEKSVYVKGEFYGDCPLVCDICEGERKIPLEELENYDYE